MPFDPSLWDNSDPTYAPGLVWGGRDSKHAYWVAQRRYVKAGYKVKRVPLGRGDKTAPVDLAMAAQCRDLTLTPNIRQRLIDIAEDLESRSGPITISNKTGNPFTPDGWSQAWARCRTAAGVPKEIWLMDTRAGALTDASQMTGVTQVMLRNAGQHKDAATTGRYLRDRSRDANKVVKLRMAK